MTYCNNYYAANRFGSAKWASQSDISQAGLNRPAGVQLGYFNNSPLYVEGDAPIITIGGAGSGKGRDVLIYNVCQYRGAMLINDPKGEAAAVSLYNQHRLGVKAYCLNPFALHALPCHQLNPLDILKVDSPTLHSDSKVIAQNFIPLSGAAAGQHFELGGQRWIDALQKFDVIMNGSTSLPQLYNLVMMIEGNSSKFAKIAKIMQQSGHSDIAQVAGEILHKQDKAPKEFTGFMSTIYNAFSFMGEPAIVDMLQGGDFSLSVLCDKKPAKIYLMIPAEFTQQYAAMTRLVFAIAMLYKQRAPQAKGVVYLVDEAGQLGNFPELLKCFTYGRGGGNRAWAVFQDIGQIAQNYGKEAITTFLGSGQTRQFFGVRDLETAQLVSQMLGSQTLHYDDHRKQRGAARAKLHAAKAMLEGNDPIYAAYDALHHQENITHQDIQARMLLTPDEVLNLPEDKQILMISGKNCPPILAQKLPYYTRREMAGKYLSNPYHPPINKVKIRGRFFMAKIKHRTRAPFRYRSFPQFQKGFKWVSGYK